MSLPSSPFLETIVRFLMPFFICADVDIDAARADILDTLASYGARSRTELLRAAQIIAFSMSVLDTLAEAKAADMSAAMRLRFRGCANGLNRACRQNETALGRRLACDPPAATALGLAPAATAAELVPAETTAELVNDATDVQAQETTQQVRAAIDAARDRLTTPHPAARPRPATSTTDRNKQAWGAAMQEVLSQMGMPSGPGAPSFST